MKKSAIFLSFLMALTMVLGTFSLFALTPLHVHATSASIDLTKQGYSNTQVISDITIDSNVSASFDKGTNSNAPKYYTSGTSVRMYANNTLTISVQDGYVICEISFLYGGTKSATISSGAVGSFNADYTTWTATSNNISNVTFTMGESGQRHFKSISVSYETASGSDVDEHNCAECLNHVSKVEPNCTESGTEPYWECTFEGCGKLFSDSNAENNITAPIEIPALKHTISNNYVVGASTVTKHTVICDRCGEEVEQDHDFSGGNCPCGQEEPAMEVVIIDTTTKGYKNQQEVTSIIQDDVVIALSSESKFFTTGNAVRVYGGKTVTITAPDNAPLTKIVFTFGSGDGSNAITANTGTYKAETKTWTGNSNSVTFTVASGSGHRRFAQFAMTYIPCQHTWENGTCTKCSKVCTHDWSDGVCSICDIHCGHNWSNGSCTVCGLVCEHNWNNGICSICEMACSHNWNNGVCTVCGSACEHSWTNSVCDICGYECSEHIDENNDEICDVCTHDMSHICEPQLVDAIAKTCTTDGCKAYYECDCGKWYSDAEGLNAITDKTSVVIPASHEFDESVWAYNDNGHYHDCLNCEADVSGLEGSEFTAHTYTDPEKVMHDEQEHIWQCDVCDYMNIEAHDFTNGDCPCGQEKPVVPTYELVTDMSELTEGTKIIIVAKDYDFALGDWPESGEYATNIAISRNDNQIGLPSGVIVLTIHYNSENGTYSFETNDNKYLQSSSASKSGNTLKLVDAHGDENFTTWTITIDENSGIATIKCTQIERWIKYNPSNPRFSTYLSGQQAIQIYKEVKEEKQYKFNEATLTLRDNLQLNFKVAENEISDFATKQAVATFNGDEYIIDGVLVNGQYVFSFNNIAPHQMNLEVSIKLMLTDGSGAVVYGKESTLSVKQYCEITYEDVGSSLALKNLIVDLLHYGAAAQVAVGDTEALVNVGHEKEVAKLNETAVASFEGNETSVAWKSAGLNLKDRVQIRFAFAAESIEGLYVRVSVNGNNYEVTEFTAAGEGRWYVFINGLDASMLHDNVSVTVMNADGAVSNTLTYSVAAYAAKVMAYEGDVNNADLYNLVSALMAYGNSAEAYTE